MAQMATIEILRARDAARGFSRAVSRVEFAGARVVLTRRGAPVAALVSIEDLARLEHALDLTRLNTEQLRELEAIFDGGTAVDGASS